MIINPVVKDSSFKKMQEVDLIEASDNKFVICKKCGFRNPLQDTKIINNFFTCSSCHQFKKYNENSLKTITKYNLKPKKYLNLIKDKINKQGLELNQEFDNYFILKNGIIIPIIFLEKASSSILLESLNSNCIIIYYSDKLKKKMENVITQSNFISYGRFLEFSHEEFESVLKVIISNHSYPDILVIKNQISDFVKKKGWRAFEKETQKVFDELRNKTNELKMLLDFYKTYRNIPLGRKYIHVGGNYEVDIEAICLFDYLNELINFEKTKGIDSKCYSSDITEHVYSSKVATNRGRQVIFVTNQHKISSKVWEHIIKAKNQNGHWHDFIVDLDTLSILVHFLKLNSLFK